MALLLVHPRNVPKLVRIFCKRKGLQWMLQLQLLCVKVSSAVILQASAGECLNCSTFAFPLAALLLHSLSSNGKICFRCSGGFMIYRDHKNKKTITIDFREVAPESATTTMYQQNPSDKRFVSTRVVF